MKGVHLFIVSSIAVKFGQAIPKSTVSEKERSYRGEPHTLFDETRKIIESMQDGRDRDRTDDLYRVKVALIPTELRARSLMEP
jgi:hypothetical protein